MQMFDTLFKSVSTQFGPRTLEKGVENLHFIFCSAFQNLRLGSIKFIGCIVVIVAGYKKIMHDCFLTFNEGIARRFPRVIDLPPYSSNELWNIFAASMGPLVGMLSTSQSSFIASMIDWLNSQEHLQVFSNQAGDMLNLATLTTEDMLLIEGQYDDDAIVETFRSFCANKNLELYS